jgi:hypothetical protein
MRTRSLVFKDVLSKEEINNPSLYLESLRLEICYSPEVFLFFIVWSSPFIRVISQA